MRVFNIKLTTVSDVQRFINVAQKYDEDIDVIRGRYVIDAKSIMGIFTLDLSEELQVAIHTDDDSIYGKLIMQCKNWISE